MLLDVVFHTALGLVAAATGYGVRTLCKHKGLLPHPVAHISLTSVLVAVESVFAVLLVG